MLRKRFTLDTNSDAATILEKLRDSCAGAGLSSQQTDEVAAVVSVPLETMIESGRSVATSGGQFVASREITTDNAAIILNARYGVPPTLFSRLRRMFTSGG